MAYSSSDIVSSTTTLLVLLIFFLTIRFIARHASKSSSSEPTSTTAGIGSDDWVALAAALGSALGCLLILVSANEGLGRSTSYSSPDQITSVLLMIWLDQINYILVMALTKTSTLLLYTRIFHAHTSEHVRFRRLCWALIGIVCLTSFFLIVFAIVMCDPVDYFWTRVTRPDSGRCKDHRPYLYANTIISIITDVLVVVLPVKQILGLQMARKKKITVLGIFGLGGVVIICSIMRATKVEDAAKRTDPMVDLAGLCIWSLVESVVSVICCCVPATYRPIKDFCKDIYVGLRDGGTDIDMHPAQTTKPAVARGRDWHDVEHGYRTGTPAHLEYGKSPVVDPRW
ncbi:hypothetical protein Slin14017_G042120 [Septoria linicola]|nr:hypothetical protein Slin14017_G042120 [Septoria linicola]